MTTERLPRAAWAIVAAAVPVHLGLALATDLSPDEAYYLCAARLAGARIVDHPPLTPWLLALSDRLGGPVELRVRVWAILFSFVTGMTCVALARARGAGPAGCTLAAWLGSWALLPMAGGFVTTPDGPLLAAVAMALLLTGWGGEVWAALALLAGALAKVVALPIAALLAASSRRLPLAARLALACVPLLALPLLIPSLRFQVHHAFDPHASGPAGAPDTWSLAASAGALLAAITAQAALWSPLVLWRGLRGLRLAPPPHRAVVFGLTALVVTSALVRGIPPEPNWWAPAALIVLVTCAASADVWSVRTRQGILATVLLPTAIAAAHTACPFLPLPARADPTARLHGWSHGAEPVEAAGVGPYGPAAERCAYRGDCTEIILYFQSMNLHATSRR